MREFTFAKSGAQGPVCPHHGWRHSQARRGLSPRSVSPLCFSALFPRSVSVFCLLAISPRSFSPSYLPPPFHRLFLSHKKCLKSFCKSQFPHKSVNSSFCYYYTNLPTHPCVVTVCRKGRQICAKIHSCKTTSWTLYVRQYSTLQGLPWTNPKRGVKSNRIKPLPPKCRRRCLGSNRGEYLS